MSERLDKMIMQACIEEGKELTKVFVMPEDNETNVCTAEMILGIHFPDEYRGYLLKYGSGGIGRFDFFGVEPQMSDTYPYSVIYNTQDCREKGLPLNYVVISNMGDYVYCVDCAEGKVYTWSWFGDKQFVLVNESFEGYFEEVLEDYI